MPYVLVGALALLAAAAFGARRASRKGGDGSPMIGSAGSRGILQAGEKELAAMLARVEATEEPEPVVGAMCYEPVAMPQVAEYVCPVCGEKTVYEGSEARLVEFELPEARRIMGEMAAVTDLEMELDESRFCQACDEEGVETPEMVLRVQWDDGREVSNVVSVTDLRMLRGFL
jgi:predicted RNA-binding Zn-ribbon protein involved in translation (DUF1610 family)